MAVAQRAATEPTPLLRNRLLRALPETELARLAPALRRVCMASRQLVFDVDCPIAYVYFPEDCVISIVTTMADGRAIETASVGCEGMVGLAVFLGVAGMPAWGFCQVPGGEPRLH